MWVTKQPVKPQRRIVAAHMLAQGLKLLSHGKPKAKELDTQLLQDLRMERAECLTNEKPTQSIFSCGPYSIDEYTSHTCSGIAVFGQVARGKPVRLVHQHQRIQTCFIAFLKSPLGGCGDAVQQSFNYQRLDRVGPEEPVRLFP